MLQSRGVHLSSKPRAMCQALPGVRGHIGATLSPECTESLSTVGIQLGLEGADVQMARGGVVKTDDTPAEGASNRWESAGGSLDISQPPRGISQPPRGGSHTASLKKAQV